MVTVCEEKGMREEMAGSSGLLLALVFVTLGCLDLVMKEIFAIGVF